MYFFQTIWRCEQWFSSKSQEQILNPIFKCERLFSALLVQMLTSNEVLRSDEEIAFRLFLYWFSLIYKYWCINICITTFFFQDLQYQSEGIDKPSTDKMVYILIAVVALMVVVLGIFTFVYIRNTLRYVKSLIKEMFLTNTIKY